MNDGHTYKEFRSDGWPLCPVCEEDELYSVLMLQYFGEGERPTIEQCLAAEMRCYQCNWSNQAAKMKEIAAVAQAYDQAARMKPSGVHLN